MRGILIVGIVGLAGLTFADRIILAPNALKVRNHYVRFEYDVELTRNRNARGYLAVGVTKEIEAELILDRMEFKPDLASLSLSYQYLPAISDAAPGIAIGIQDLMDRTSERRMAYLAFTYRFGLDGPHNSQTPLELTLGFGAGRRSGIFVGAMIPFTWQFRLLADHNTQGVSAGLEYFPLHNASLR
ncbi:MAG: hypothetical protein ABL962_16810, partial [Fimbriimonadaceae bacterium]